MFTEILSIAFNGIDITPINVQVKIEPGIPKFTIVGLADKAIAESRERVAASLSSIGLAIPAKKILINLAPADLIKEGSHFDLAISCAILAAIKALPAEEISEYFILGELSLSGEILPVNGILPAAIGANSYNKGLICPQKNGSEASWSGNEKILAPSNLLELINHFKGTQVLSKPTPQTSDKSITYPDFKDIRGQETAKRVLEIAAAGGHNLLMFGPPGSGKSMMAERMPGILPELTVEEILECSAISSVAGNLNAEGLTRFRPFRSPHHSCTQAAMIGGGAGKKVKPGEISLAHNGILFLDEFPEFSPAVIESLRQPLETKNVLIARSGNHIKYPANFQLIAAMNPCKCGYLGDEFKACKQAPTCATKYQSRLSGPILDRFDMHLEINNEQNNYNYHKMLEPSQEESSANIAKRVNKARNTQYNRYEGYNIKLNKDLSNQLLIDYAIPVDDGKDLLNNAATKFKLSMRSYNKILKVARTIADLDESRNVFKIHIAEALNYRHMNYTTLLNV